MKKRKYIIVNGYLNPYGSNVPNIEVLVNLKIKDGYLPVFGLVHVVGNEYSQAMILNEDK